MTSEDIKHQLIIITKRVSAHRGKTEICKYFVFLHSFFFFFCYAINIYATQVHCWSMGGEGAWWGFQFCHWRELPQVSFLSRQKLCRCNTCFSRQTGVFLDKTRLLLRQKYACRDKRIFVATKLLLRQIFVAINIILFTTVLSRQVYCCRDKYGLVYDVTGTDNWWCLQDF